MSEPEYVTSVEAEEAFYAAFEQADAEAMASIWLNDDSIVCVHPMSGQLTGWEEVTRVWRELFSGGANMSFEISQQRYTEDGMLAIHVVQENITLLSSGEQQPPVVATNIYQRTDAGWRMILHHASPIVQQIGGVGEEPDVPPVLH